MKKGKKTLSHIVIGSIAVLVLCSLSHIGVFAGRMLEKPEGVLVNGVKDCTVLSWEPVTRADGYEVYEKEEGTDFFIKRTVTPKEMVVFSQRKRGAKYLYKVRAYRAGESGTIYGKYSKAVETTLSKTGTTTLKNFLATAIAPVGSAMYIWGGGWNKADTGAGKDALRIGLNANWRKYASAQKSSYNYKNTRYKRGYGLDCSGFVGWAIFNVMEIKKGKPGEGYVDNAAKLAKKYAGYSWGTYRDADRVINYQAGDIMSSKTHVYIVLGQCEDGSVAFVHSSPAGVQLCGTVSQRGRIESQAVRLSRKYMKKNAPFWYARFSKCVRDRSYLTQYHQFRWKLTKKSVMTDPDGYADASPEEILRDLYSE